MLFFRRSKSYRYVKTTPAVPVRCINQRPGIKADILKLVGYISVSIGVVGLLVLASPWLIAESITTLQQLQRHLTIAAFKPEPASFEERQATPSAGFALLLEPLPPDPATLPFTLTIPKLSLETAVVSNVDAGNQIAYTSALRQGVAHARGSAFPGQGKMIYIFGHSTDYAWNVATYNALFYQVKDLIEGDKVFLKLGDKEYSYTVSARYIAAPDDLTVIEENYHNNILILQTCYPPGTTWQRLLVVALPESEA